MKLAIVVTVILAGVFLQASSHPAGETAVAEVAANVGTDVLQFSGGYTYHAFLAQVANLVVTVSPHNTLFFRFCNALLDAIQGYKSGNVVTIDVALSNLKKSDESLFVRIATLITAFTAPNVSWKDIHGIIWQHIHSSLDTFKSSLHQSIESNPTGIISDIFTHLQKKFSN